MKHLFTSILFLGILWLAACTADKKTEQDAAEPSPPLNVQLVCEATSEDPDTPQNGVFMIVNESKTKIANINACDKINPSDYATYDIPKEAIIAVGGWWAGAGDYFYVLRQETSLTVYHAQVDEEQEVEGYRYLPTVSYRDGRFNFDLE
ncbi:MAG: hypothetical protein HUU01_10745 [Saprospiraceae bacterium]|nr:hypothetical protein [Saprospiraceae bacterium]